MKKAILILFLIQMILQLGCSNSNTYGNYTDDIKSIQPYSKTDSLLNNEIELKYASVYKKISTDNSRDAMRIIGEIQDTKISAKEFELEALRLQLKGSKKIYSDAWDELKKSFLENEIAEKYKLDYQSDAAKLVEQNQRHFVESKDELVIKYIEKLYKAYGMSEDEYWNKYMLNLYQKQLCHDRVEKYLNDNNLPDIKPNQVQGEIIDKYYLEIINFEAN